MKIGVAGPITLSRLAARLGEPFNLPRGYEFPLIADMVIELLRRGHSVSVFTLDSSISSPLTFEANNLTVHVGRMRTKHRGRDLFRAERTDLEEGMRSDPCDLIHAHWTYEFALAAQATGRPYIVTAHDSPLDNARLYRMPYWWIRAALARHVVTPRMSLSAVSPYIIKHYERFFRAKDVRLIPNGVPLELLGDTPAIPRNGAPWTTFATILGGWDRRKNGLTAIEAFALVRRELPGARLLMFGRGYGPGEDAQRYAARRSVASGIEFAGHLDPGLLRHRLCTEVDILVHPARIDSFGMVLLEAITAGVTVIAGERSGGVPWTLGYGRCGVLVDIEDSAAVARSMAALSADEERRRDLTVAARAYVRQHFGLPDVISRYEEWYESAATCWPHAVGATR